MCLSSYFLGSTSCWTFAQVVWKWQLTVVCRELEMFQIGVIRALRIRIKWLTALSKLFIFCPTISPPNNCLNLLIISPSWDIDMKDKIWEQKCKKFEIKSVQPCNYSQFQEFTDAAFITMFPHKTCIQLTFVLSLFWVSRKKLYNPQRIFWFWKCLDHITEKI